MQNTPSIRLVVRADDAGSFAGANEAIEQCVNARVVKNISLMVPSPTFEDAASRFAGRTDVCLGLHITLNSELNFPKWGPVSPPETVKSLLDENGHFWKNPAITQQQGFKVDEAMREIEAQLSLARKSGLKISYIDEHMGVGRIGLRPQIAELCRREGLIIGHGIASLTLGTTLEAAESALTAASPGDYLWITHPGIFSPETQHIHSARFPDDGGFIRARDAERQLLINPNLPSVFTASGVQASRYDEIYTV